MSVRKHKLGPWAQQDAKEHIVVEASRDTLSARDLSSLHKHRTQRVLTLRHLHSDSLDFLLEWKALRSLKMYGCKVGDCSALTKLRNLRDLWYNGNRDKNPDLAFLSALKHIEKLGIGHVTHLTALPDLSRCTRLRDLSIFSCKKLRDVDAVTGIPKLQRFSIVCTPQMPGDLESIMAMKTLTTMSGAFGSKKRDSLFAQLLEKHGLGYG